MKKAIKEWITGKRTKVKTKVEESKIKRIQRVLCVTVNGVWGSESQEALDALIK